MSEGLTAVCWSLALCVWFQLSPPRWHEGKEVDFHRSLCMWHCAAAALSMLPPLSAGPSFCQRHSSSGRSNWSTAATSSSITRPTTTTTNNTTNTNTITANTTSSSNNNYNYNCTEAFVQTCQPGSMFEHTQFNLKSAVCRRYWKH